MSGLQQTPHEGTAEGRVRASRIGASFDLLAALGGPGFLFERGGLGVGAAGGGGIDIGAEPGARAVGDVGSAALRRLRSLEGPASGPAPVAVGAFPFDVSEATLRIPARAVRRPQSGESWLIQVTADARDPAPFVPRPVRAAHAPHEAFTDLQLTALPSADAYAEAVHDATERILAGDLRKVVLARQIVVAAGRNLDPRLLAARLRAVDPSAYTFVVPVSGGVLVGASPELLVAKEGTQVRSNPLAGSAARSGDPEEDRESGRSLEASAKDRDEHEIVVEAVAETLRPFCDELTWDPEPVLLPTANVWHLSTRFRGTLRDPPPHVLELVAALHPTPAVCGTPRSVARATIDEMEPFDRGGYAGPVGWIDAAGDGEWAIALRCAELAGDHATLFAGAGIVAGSEPAGEVDETERKFRAFLDSLRWG
jgi:isochorismate synthase